MLTFVHFGQTGTADLAAAAEFLHRRYGSAPIPLARIAAEGFAAQHIGQTAR